MLVMLQLFVALFISYIYLYDIVFLYFYFVSELIHDQIEIFLDYGTVAPQLGPLT